ncbi:CHAT domain-containing protein [Ekhidna sp. To15]|uniref:CHAT domain-containing protein n=1 Tax=Ekhidna sp. To15 TaxID=3395267 RepID=UPI003F51D3DF
MRRKFILLFILSITLFSLSKGQDLIAKYDSAIQLTERAQLVPAVNILKSIKSDLYLNEKYFEYFSAQYFLSVYYAMVERDAQAAEDTLRSNLSKAVEISGENSAGAAEMYFGLGWLADRMGNRPLAEENYKQALDIQSEVFGSSHKKTLKTKTNYAQVLTTLNNLGRAESYLIELIESYPDIYEANHPEYVRLYTLAFNFYKATSEREKELSYALAAFELGEVNYGPTNARMLNLMRNVSNAYYESNDHNSAAEYAEKEFELVNKLVGNTPHIRKAQIINNLGRFYDKGEQYDSAVIYFKNALGIKKELLGDGHPETLNSAINLSFALNKRGQINESSEHLKTVISLLDSGEVDKFDINYQRASYSLLQTLSSKGERDSVISLVEEHYKIFQENIDRPLLASDKHENMMAMLEELSMISNIQKASTTEFNAITPKIYWLDSLNEETFRRMNLRSDQLGFLKNYTAFNGVAIDHLFELYSRNQDEKLANEILRFSEKNKATILSPEYSIARLKDALNVPIETLEKERKLLSELSSDDLDEQTALKKKLSYDSIVLFLKTNYEDYYNLKYGKSDISIKIVQDALPENTQMLSYVFSGEYLYTILIGNSDFSIQRQKTGSLLDQIMTFRNKIVAIEELEEDSKELHQRLVSNGLNDKKLIISTQDFLAFLPFELLHDGVDFIGLTNPISYAPSINMWMNSLNIDPYPNTQVLAMAPDFNAAASVTEDANRDLLVSIPGAVQELNLIKEYFSGEFLLADEATKDNFINNVSDFGIVHLATHAIIDNSNPNLSRLYFSQVEEQEPYIKNYELYNLDMNANLVTLSACNTGIGEIQKGDGANSLARGFIYAGVPSTVVSLWPASDKSTPDLMKYFYQNLKEGQTKDVALNNARKQYLATATGKARHPFYWGGFVVIGDNSPIEDDRNLLVYLIPSILIIVMILTVYRRRKIATKRSG